MMDQKAVRLMVCLAVLPQILADRLALFPGIGKDQTFLSPGMLEDIADARIGRLGRGICGDFRDRGFRHGLLSLIRLGRGIIEMLHGQPPDFLSAVKSGDNGLPSAAGGEETACRFGIPDGSGEADPSGAAPASLQSRSIRQKVCMPRSPRSREWISSMTINRRSPNRDGISMCLLIISDSRDSGVICRMPEGFFSSLRF